MSFAWKDVSYKVKVDKENSKLLLDGHSGRVNAGEMVAIMGGSGAGKSTLLNTLAGRIGPGDLAGQVYFNGKKRDRRNWTLQCAYVEQDDVLFKTLSVWETIMYSAKLRLPRTMTMAEKEERATKVINQLGLAGCRNTRIGDEINRGISGGERKRVSIGVELVTNPQLLFLDEPTSGLDAFNAFNAMDSIKTLAKNDAKIVLCTIHQPRTDILDLFDKIILLSAGKLIWFGTTDDAITHFAGLGYKLPPKTNPSDYFLDITTMDRRTPELIVESTARVALFENAFKEYCKTHPTEMPAVEEVAPRNTVTAKRPVIEWPSSPFTEFSLLFQRSLINNVRDRAVIGASLGMNLFTTFLVGCLFWQMPFDASGIQNRSGLFFFYTINLAMGNIMPVVNMFPEQRKIYKRERASGSYRSASAFLSATAARLPLVLSGATIFLVSSYWLAGLQPSAGQFFTFMVIMYAHILAAVFLGMTIGGAVPSVQVGQIITPMIIIIFVLFGGLLVNINSLPEWLRWIQWISIFTYTNKALTQNEYTSSFPFACPGTYCGVSGPTLVTSLSMDTPALWYCVLINFCLGIAYLLGGIALFERSSKPLMRLE